MSDDSLNRPHGGRLNELLVSAEEAAELKAASAEWPSVDLTHRQLCDLELLLNGGFSPLTGFLTRADYDSVCQRMRLSSGLLWPMPITLDVPEELANSLSPGRPLMLRDPEGVALAVLDVEDVWQPDREDEAEAVFGTADRAHPGVSYLLGRSHPFYVGGRLRGLQLPAHYDFRPLRHTPAELRDLFHRLGWRRVVAFQTRNPMHKAHHAMTLHAVKRVEANLLIHPVVGMTKPGDIDHYTRVKCYQHLLEHYPQYTASLSLLPLAMRMAGPREAVWHALIRKNYGASHFIVGRDHAGPGNGSDGEPFYGPYEAQELMRRHEEEIGVELVPFELMTYAPERDRYLPIGEIREGERTLTVSGSELRRRLADGREIPKWFTFPEVAEELQKAHPPRHRQGFTVFFTGLSGSGKSTLANVMMIKLLEMGGRPVTLLDGDVVRKHLSSELGFSKRDRDINIRRIGFVASEITKNGGIAICAPIAPYDAMRKEIRGMIEPLLGQEQPRITVNFQDADIRDVLASFAEFTGRSIVPGAGVEGEITATIRDQPWDVALQTILDANGLTIRETETGILRAIAAPRGARAPSRGLGRWPAHPRR